MDPLELRHTKKRTPMGVYHTKKDTFHATPAVMETKIPG